MRTRVRLVSAVAAIATALLCALPAPAGAVERGVMADLTWDISTADFAPTQAAITDIGAGSVRLEFRWYEGEPRQDDYDTSTLDKWDRAMDVAEASGAEIIAMVHRAPKWASGQSTTYGTPQNVADYANFMRFLAERYRGRVAAWEIWNEQNSERFWPTGPDAAEYVQLLRAAYPAVKQADPSALVAFGGLAYSDFYYVSQAYKAGAKGWFDVMTTHPYSDQFAPNAVWYAAPGLIAMKSFTAYREVRKRMLGYGDDKPIWFTEFGWSTSTTSPKGVTHEQQASYLTSALCIMEQDPYVDVAVWYNLRNNHWNDDADSWETQLGLMKTTFERKPAYDAFKNYDPSKCPPVSLPDPVPTPTPDPLPTLEPEPDPTDPADPDETGEPEDEGEIGDVSTIRSRTTTLLRWSDVARAAGPRVRAHTTRAGKVTLRGRVRGADSGRINLQVRRTRPGGKSAVFNSKVARPAVVQAASVGANGRFRFKLNLRGQGKWRVRAVYVGTEDAYPSRSRLVKFRV
jgi:hypothetical protein